MSSHEIWTKLKVIHDQRANDNIHDLQVKFYQCKFKASDGIVSFISKLEVLKSQLACLRDSSISESNLIAKVFGNLPDYFNHFHSARDNTSSAKRTLNNFLIRLIREELRIKQVQAREQLNSPAAAYVVNLKGGNSDSHKLTLMYEQR